MPKTKKCKACGLDKPIDTDFSKRKKSADGLRPTCKACDALVRDAYARRMRGENPPEPAEVPSEPIGSPTGAPGESAKVIGHIGAVSPGTPRIREVAVDPTEDLEKAAAAEYSAILNRRLPVRTRARLMVEIARNTKGFNAALAMKAIADINLATGVTSRSGAKIDLGPLFVLPEGSDVKLTG